MKPITTKYHATSMGTSTNPLLIRSVTLAPRKPGSELATVTARVLKTAREPKATIAVSTTSKKFQTGSSGRAGGRVSLGEVAAGISSGGMGSGKSKAGPQKQCTSCSQGVVIGRA